MAHLSSDDSIAPAGLSIPKLPEIIQVSFYRIFCPANRLAMARFLVSDLKCCPPSADQPNLRELGQKKDFRFWNTMSDSLQKSTCIGSACRRSKIERRVFSYTEHVPERRSGRDRRGFKDQGKNIENGESLHLKTSGEDRQLKAPSGKNFEWTALQQKLLEECNQEGGNQQQGGRYEIHAIYFDDAGIAALSRFLFTNEKARPKI